MRQLTTLAAVALFAFCAPASGSPAPTASIAAIPLAEHVTVVSADDPGIFLLQTAAKLRHGPSDKQPDCTQRVPRDGQWWEDWRGRVGLEKGETSSEMPVWNALQDADLEWLSFIDGWAIARDGKYAFQGSQASKNGNSDSAGDFLGVASQVLTRMQSVPFEDKLTAEKIEWVITPLLLASVGKMCHSQLDPYTFGTRFFDKCYGGDLAECTVWHINQTILSTMQSEMDPELYDSNELAMRDIGADRLPTLQRYLDEYYSKVEVATEPDDKLDALIELATRYARLHVFCDGNGRMRNLLISRELVRLGFHPSLMFDYNHETFFLTRSLFKEVLIEGFYMWEDAVRHHCVPWTADTVKSHNELLGPPRIGLASKCTAEHWDALGLEYNCKELFAK